jgi:hypothetical protein
LCMVRKENLLLTDGRRPSGLFGIDRIQAFIIVLYLRLLSRFT